MRLILIWTILLGGGLSLFGQSPYRVEADFSIKSKYQDSLSNLTMGRAYFDRNHTRLVYQVRFPEPEIWVFHDTTFVRQTADSVIRQKSDPSIIKVSVFSLALNNDLPNYGMNDSLYEKVNVKQENGLIISTWQAIGKLQDYLGNIHISRKGKELYGVVMMNPEGEIVSKQFFRKYDFSGGIPFPTEVISITYKDQIPSYQITTFENIQFNVSDSDSLYNYVVPH